MPPAGFEFTIPTRQWLQTHAFHCSATGIGKSISRRANSNTIIEKRTLSTQAKTNNFAKIEEGKLGFCKLNLTGRQNTTPLQRVISYTPYPVDIATRYGLDGSRIEFRWGKEFPHPSRPDLGLTQPPMQMAPSHSRAYRGQGVALITHPI